MQVLPRIRARKIVLLCYYQCYFFLSFADDLVAIKDVLSACDISPSDRTYLSVFHDVRNNILTYPKQLRHNFDNFLEYALAYIFPNWSKDIDSTYILSMVSAFETYYATIATVIDRYVTSFTFDNMDVIDKALFLLGYVEYNLFHTPPAILLNELVELAKRYADSGSAKLLNGIMHKVLHS